MSSVRPAAPDRSGPSPEAELILPLARALARMAARRQRAADGTNPGSAQA